MDITTMRAVLKSELRQNSPYIDGAIADAIDFNKNEPLKFNGAVHTFITSPNVYSYDMPQDYLSLRGEVYLTPNSGEANNRSKITGVTIDTLEDYLFTNYSSSDSTLDCGLPRMYAIDTFGDPPKFMLAPRPSTGGDTVFFRYTKDIGTPKYSASVASASPPSLAPTFTLLAPNGGTLPSTFTNAWFTEGRELIRSRAMYYLWTRYHAGTEEAQLKGQAALMQWTEEVIRHRKESTGSSLPHQVRKFI